MTDVVSKIGQKKILNSGTAAAKASEVHTGSFLNGMYIQNCLLSSKGNWPFHLCLGCILSQRKGHEFGQNSSHLVEDNSQKGFS